MTVPTQPVEHTGLGKVSRAERVGLINPIAGEIDTRNDAEQLADKLDAALKQFGYEIHPKAQETPSLTMAEYLSLRQKIGESGMLQPILVHKDTLVDGRHRLMAAYDLQMPPNVKQLHDAADLEEVIYNSEARRHQTKSQMAAFTVLFYEDKVRELTAAGVESRRAGVPQGGDRHEVSPVTFVQQTAAVGNNMAKQAVALLNAGRIDLLVDVRDSKISSMEKAYQQYLDENKDDEDQQDAGFINLNARLSKVGAAIQTLNTEIDKLKSLTYAAEENSDLDDLIEAVEKFSGLYAGNAYEIGKSLVPAGYEGSDREARAAWMKEHADLSPAEWSAAYKEAFNG